MPVPPGLKLLIDIFLYLYSDEFAFFYKLKTHIYILQAMAISHCYRVCNYLSYYASVLTIQRYLFGFMQKKTNVPTVLKSTSRKFIYYFFILEKCMSLNTSIRSSKYLFSNPAIAYFLLFAIEFVQVISRVPSNF